MKPSRQVIILLAAGFLGSCSNLPEQKSSTLDRDSERLFESVHNLFPGTYSNFGRQNEGMPVSDVSIRQLTTEGEPVFLLENRHRDLLSASYDLYWLKFDPDLHKAVFHFTRLRENELSLDIPEVLSQTSQRLRPGCVVEIRASKNRISGNTDPNTCLFEHPLEGEIAFSHTISITEDTLDIENELTGDGDILPIESQALLLDRHRQYAGSASLIIPPEPGSETSTIAKQSQTIELLDDGRIIPMYDNNLAALKYGLQLAKLTWREDEPPFIRLSVIDLETGVIQAYAWFHTSKENLDLDLDWIRIHLTLKNPDGF